MKQYKYLIAPENWTPDDINPFKDNGLYNKDFTCIYFTDDDDSTFINGTSKSGLYNVIMHKKVEDLDQKVLDFLHYENQFKRTVILGSNYNLNIKKYIDSIGSAYNPYEIRTSDPIYLVHSTNLTAWKSIQNDNFLKSAAQLDRESISYTSIGYQELSEPEEYNDFVMFGGLGAGPEVIVLSQQMGRIETNKNCQYKPGVRIYLDCHKMIKDKIIYRDGLHMVKVKSKLDLNKYMLFSTTARDLNKKSITAWTPDIFARESDNHFHEYMQKNNH